MAACFIRGRRQKVCEFSASTRELLALVDWLLEGGCPYWKPLYNILESLGLEAMVDVQHMRTLPGRKTDVKDSEWIADLLQHGLLTASFIPDKAQRELRELVGYRKSLV